MAYTSRSLLAKSVYNTSGRVSMPIEAPKSTAERVVLES